MKVGMAKPCGLVKPCHLVKPVSATRVSGRYLTHQKGLPTLPVPPLQQTCERYITALEPIVDADELQHTKELVDEFKKPGSVGKRLQAALEKRACNTENWVSSAGNSGWKACLHSHSQVNCTLIGHLTGFCFCTSSFLCSCQSGGCRLLTWSTGCLW